MADPIEELNAVFMACGINDAGMHVNIIAQEGFTQLEDLGVLETDTDVTEMAKRMAFRIQAEGRVLLGTVIIKRLQTLVLWVRDHQKQGLALEAANFDVAAINEVAEMKNLWHELNDKEPPIPNDFNAHKDAFMNLLAQSYGVLRKPLCYIVRLDMAPVTFTMDEESRRMYQFPLTGSSF